MSHLGIAANCSLPGSSGKPALRKDHTNTAVTTIDAAILVRERLASGGGALVSGWVT
jgi:hypothetical protein